LLPRGFFFFSTDKLASKQRKPSDFSQNKCRKTVYISLKLYHSQKPRGNPLCPLRERDSSDRVLPLGFPRIKLYSYYCNTTQLFIGDTVVWFSSKLLPVMFCSMFVFSFLISFLCKFYIVFLQSKQWVNKTNTTQGN